jgi:hypothetical protein
MNRTLNLYSIFYYNIINIRILLIIRINNFKTFGDLDFECYIKYICVCVCREREREREGKNLKKEMKSWFCLYIYIYIERERERERFQKKI